MDGVQSRGLGSPDVAPGFVLALDNEVSAGAAQGHRPESVPDAAETPPGQPGNGVGSDARDTLIKKDRKVVNPRAGTVNAVATDESDHVGPKEDGYAKAASAHAVPHVPHTPSPLLRTIPAVLIFPRESRAGDAGVHVGNADGKVSPSNKVPEPRYWWSRFCCAIESVDC